MALLSTGTKPRASRTTSGIKQRTLIEIKVDQHFESKIYTSGSVISGTVSVSSSSNLAFQKFDLVLFGRTTASIHIQHDAPPSSHTFLRLSMPVSESNFSDAHILQAGQIYNIPFLFKIPHQLPGVACRYEDGDIHERHLQPPPTTGSWEHDDLTNKAIRVQYAVRARLVVGREKDGREKTIEKSHEIRVIPLFPEQPPLHIGIKDSEYRLFQEKKIRKYLGSPKLGRLRVLTAQPSPVTLSTDGLQTSTLSLMVNLEFTPSSRNATPPEVYAKSASIDATTTYSLGHMSYLPDQHKRPAMETAPRAPYWKSNDLIIEKQERVLWKHSLHYPSNDSRRTSEATSHDQESVDSLRSAGSSESSRSDELVDTGAIRYRARLSLSFTLPSNRKKLFLPTFYSCLVSRTYTMHVVMAVRSYGTSLTLTVPVQIATDDSNAMDADLPGYVSGQSRMSIPTAGC